MAGPEADVDADDYPGIKRMPIYAPGHREVVGINAGRSIHKEGHATTGIKLVSADQCIVVQVLFGRPLRSGRLARIKIQSSMVFFVAAYSGQRQSGRHEVSHLSVDVRPVMRNVQHALDETVIDSCLEEGVRKKGFSALPANVRAD